MNIFILVSNFWRMAEEEKFTPSEAALYFYLLNRANTQRWKMPIRCPTSTILAYISTTKQNVMKAREGLKQKGFITFVEGSGGKGSPQYTLTNPSTELSTQLSTELSTQLSGELSTQLPEQLSYYKNKNKNIIFSHNACKKHNYSLSDLRSILSGDSQWKQNILASLANEGITSIVASDVDECLRIFFDKLIGEGVTNKEEDDCRKHFYNWMLQRKLNQKKNNHETYNEQQSTKHSRNLHVNAKPEDFEGAF